MSWCDLLFAHWRVDADRLASAMPAGLQPDVFDGSAWVGVVPFWMRGIRSRWGPAVPGLSSFAELNVRTYATVGGRPGVYFFSLDAAHRLGVRVARWRFNLPYFDAAMQCEREGDTVRYTSRRTHRATPPAELACRYRPVGGELPAAEPGTLDHFLTERYCLYVPDRRGRLTRGEIDHARWPLRAAEATFEELAMTRLLGLLLEDEPAHLRYASRVDVHAWTPELV